VSVVLIPIFESGMGALWRVNLLSKLKTTILPGTPSPPRVLAI